MKSIASWPHGPAGEGRSADSSPKPLPVRSDGSTPKAVVTAITGHNGTSTYVNGNGGSTPGIAPDNAAGAAGSLSPMVPSPYPTDARGAESKLRMCAACKRKLPFDSFRSLSARKCEECRSNEPVRVCVRCKDPKPISEFRHGRRKCCNCADEPSPSSAALQPRVCVRCWEKKPADDFGYTAKPKGDGVFRRRRGVCRQCQKKIRDKKRRDRLRRKKESLKRTWTNDEGVVVRVCNTCKVPKPLEAEFYVTRRRNGIVERYYQCRGCQIERVTAYQKNLLANPLTREHERARRREWQRSWRARNPEKTRDSAKKWLDTLRADPVRWARKLEGDRLGYAMRRERAGLPRRNTYRPDPRTNRLLERHYGIALPSWPVVELFDSMILTETLKRGTAISSRKYGTGPTRDDPSITLVCNKADLPPRTLYRWRHEGGDVRFTTADMILTNLGLLWWEVWKEPEEQEGTGRPDDVLAWIDYAWAATEAYATAKRVFEGRMEDDERPPPRQRATR